MGTIDKSYGIILVLRKDNDEDEFLILQQWQGHWSFPKGHGENGETPIQIAIRELAEETSIIGIELSKFPSIKDDYVVAWRGSNWHKTVECYIAFTRNENVTIQNSEVQGYKWATYKEALDTLNFEGTKNVLKTAKKYLDNMVK